MCEVDAAMTCPSQRDSFDGWRSGVRGEIGRTKAVGNGSRIWGRSKPRFELMSILELILAPGGVLNGHTGDIRESGIAAY